MRGDTGRHKGSIKVGSKTYKLTITYGFDTVRIPAPKAGRYTLVSEGAKATIVVR